jgi:chemotaxis protein MotB
MFYNAAAVCRITLRGANAASVFSRISSMRFHPLLPVVLLGALTGCVTQSTYDKQVAATRAAQNQSAEFAALNKDLAAEIEAKTATIEQLNNQLKVTLVDQLLFASGSAEIVPAGRAALDKVAPTLAGVTGDWVIVKGYTDDQPIGPSIRDRYPTNWDLSTARATAVVKYLQAKGVQPVNLAAEGYSEYQPVGPNMTAAGRHANRRIELVLQAK